MDTLSQRNYELIAGGVNAHGSYNPEEILYFFEERLRIDDVEPIISFLQWCHNTGSRFGRGNYAALFQEYLSHNRDLIAVGSTLTYNRAAKLKARQDRSN